MLVNLIEHCDAQADDGSEASRLCPHDRPVVQLFVEPAGGAGWNDEGLDDGEDVGEW
ncbi:hypothetical protein ABN034_32990 [Actinopolymorpha sp. B11F2]|uniref:hypothetical protein n=1 Tax=Actinopolymorpha sp. B11F2 TaxID=3160862 RepID=UPI0032E40C2A